MFSLDNSNAVRILRLLFPDLIILATSLICLIIIRRRLILSRRHQRQRQVEEIVPSLLTSPSTLSERSSPHLWPRFLSIVRRLRLSLQFVLVGVAAFLCPSVLNSMYFLFFLLMSMYSSLSIRFDHRFTRLRSVLLVYTGVHLLLFYLYQFGFFQDVLQPRSFPSKSVFPAERRLSR